MTHERSLVGAWHQWVLVAIALFAGISVMIGWQVWKYRASVVARS